MEKLCSLGNEYEIRLHFGAPSTPYRVHCQTTDCSEECPNADETSKGLDDFQCVDLNSEDISFTRQMSCGMLINAQSYVVFRTRTTQLQSLCISVTVYKHDPNTAPADLHTVQGQAKILPSMFAQGSDGKVTVTLELSNNNIGQELEVDYLIIKPVANLRNSTKTCVWDHSQENLDIGHRGMGKCRSKLTAPYVLENTVKSFNMAASCGADYVEFDVQLTKDNIPIVFHDFLCRLPAPDDQKSSSAYKDVSVQELTYDELFKLKASFAVETGTTEEVLPNDESSKESESLFPKLVDVFEQVHPSLGFNVEIKYPTRLKNGDMEDGLMSFMDMNQYVDIMLRTIDEHAGSRRIVLTCFNPDVCIVLKLKQRRFPVLFLTQGEVLRYQAFLDPRTRSVPIALKFAAAEGFLGINPISEYILKDVSLVKRARDLGLVMMCWGSENSDKTIINTLKQNTVHAVIYDRINEFIGEDKSKNAASQI